MLLHLLNGYFFLPDFQTSAATESNSYFLVLYYFTSVSLLAVLLDRLLGEFKYFHPLVLFGRVANYLEKNCNPHYSETKTTNTLQENDYRTRLRGVVAVIVLVFPVVAILISLHWLTSDFVWLWLIVDSFILYLCIGLKSMQQHMLAIANPLTPEYLSNERLSKEQLSNEQLHTARRACAMIVSRDVEQLDAQQMAKAAVESTLENTNDAIIASLFWYFIGGAPGAVIHRLVNTLDAMWGYKNRRFKAFGWCPAKLDDLLAWIPARITAMLFALQGIRAGKTLVALRLAQQQSRDYKSRNGGWVMSAGATVLGISLGGQANYDGVAQPEVTLGEVQNSRRLVSHQHIHSALSLMKRALYSWLLGLLLVSVSVNLIAYWFG